MISQEMCNINKIAMNINYLSFYRDKIAIEQIFTKK